MPLGPRPPRYHGDYSPMVTCAGAAVGAVVCAARVIWPRWYARFHLHLDPAGLADFVRLGTVTGRTAEQRARRCPPWPVCCSFGPTLVATVHEPGGGSMCVVDFADAATETRWRCLVALPTGAVSLSRADVRMQSVGRLLLPGPQVIPDQEYDLLQLLAPCWHLAAARPQPPATPGEAAAALATVRALILGVGGGLQLSALLRAGVACDAVDRSPAAAKCAAAYFGLPQPAADAVIRADVNAHVRSLGTRRLTREDTYDICLIDIPYHPCLQDEEWLKTLGTSALGGRRTSVVCCSLLAPGPELRAVALAWSRAFGSVHMFNTGMQNHAVLMSFAGAAPSGPEHAPVGCRPPFRPPDFRVPAWVAALAEALPPALSAAGQRYLPPDAPRDRHVYVVGGRGQDM